MKHDNPYAALQKLFHEPARLSITSALCQDDDGKAFADLKKSCNLTDGNLNRHLKVLEEAGAVILVKKTEKGSRPQTRAILTDRGREGFMSYLQVLERVLKQAAEALHHQATPAGYDFGLGESLHI
ncbi:MAG: DNA-binding HxlR family transcriptional regulator [Kiritimatiellia bacterium]|jgi:DNA-binding HxlR family transcriptional regulator